MNGTKNILYYLILIRNFGVINKMQGNNQIISNIDYTLIKKSKYFDSNWYFEKHLSQDFIDSNIDPIVHFLSEGWRLGYDPSEKFSIKDYFEQNGDVEKADVNPLLHYEKYGKKQGRYISKISKEMSIIKNSSLCMFDCDWYANKYCKDLQKDESVLLHHFVTNGWKNGFNPSPLFDTSWYLENNQDVAESGKNPLVHYILYGYFEGRPPRDFSKNIIYVDYIEKVSNKREKESFLQNILRSPRISVEELVDRLKKYDVISFDIFDTALLRCVDQPKDIFTILGMKHTIPDFANIRSESEKIARKKHEKKYGNREITIDEIYDVANTYFGIDKKIKDKEIELEKNSIIANSYILSVYQKLKELNKTIIFVSDMYLPKKVINEILLQNGYNNFDELFLSNDLQLSKEDMTIQGYLLEKFQNKRIVHIGDNYRTDYTNFRQMHIDAVFNDNARLKSRFAFCNNISGSILKSVIGNEINTLKLKNKCSAYYFHGFLIGGILTAGYCKFINEIASNYNIEKILFCARDCAIVSKVYTKYYSQRPSEYIDISRLSIMKVMPEKYAYDILKRFIFRYWDNNRNLKTIEQMLNDTGYGYLVDELEKFDIEKYLYCSSVKKEVFEEFFYNTISLQKKYALPSIKNAKRYFSEKIGNSKKICIADIGWSGSCFNVLRDFIHEYIDPNILVIGSIMIASDSVNVSTQVISNELFAYICSPIGNNDALNFIHPKQNKDLMEKYHMCLEYLFTSTEPSLLSYNDIGSGQFERSNNKVLNQDVILDMQDGILYFNQVYKDYIERLNINISVPPYVAFTLFRSYIQNSSYINHIYASFAYDGCSIDNKQSTTYLFSSAVGRKNNAIIETENKEHIIFISNELIYTGAPRSLLRVCKVAKELGYSPILWSMVDGPFRNEFEKENIPVYVVPVSEVNKEENLKMVRSSKMVYCNTVVTDDYVNLLKDIKPTVWFIREASNLPEFISRKPSILTTLQTHDKIYCVSSYAAKFIQPYVLNTTVRVLNNCVEDEIEYAIQYKNGTSKKIRFVQFGTIEYRKGYDLIYKAYKELPSKYQDLCELYFAGGSLNSQTNYMSQFMEIIKDEKNIHYLGIVSGEENKIQALSSMDVVIVASRDESCSLVALEGAMLSKPLIVTENVGAKYIVENGSNGIIVKSDDVYSLKNAMMSMIDSRKSLASMGEKSRLLYDKLASMQKHKKDLGDLFNLQFEPKVIVSLTSYPKRMSTIVHCIKSLLEQSYSNFSILLYLSKLQFPNLEKDLNEDILSLLETHKDKLFIRFVEGDIRSHKKYFYAMQEYEMYPVVTVDDDFIYEKDMLKNLVDSYIKNPDCISCHRGHQILFNKNGLPREYKNWRWEFTMNKGLPLYSILATGCMGVLYPPRAIPKIAFNEEWIKKSCLLTDDLWLKVMSVLNGVKTLVVLEPCKSKEIPNSQETALWKENVFNNNNDVSFLEIIALLKKHSVDTDDLLKKMRFDLMY